MTKRKLSNLINPKYLLRVKTVYSKLEELEKSKLDFKALDKQLKNIKASLKALKGGNFLLEYGRIKILESVLWNLDIYDSPEKVWWTLKQFILNRNARKPNLQLNITIYLVVSKLEYPEGIKQHYPLITEWLAEEGISPHSLSAKKIRKMFDHFEQGHIIENLFNQFGILMSEETPPEERRDIVFHQLLESCL